MINPMKPLWEMLISNKILSLGYGPHFNATSPRRWKLNRHIRDYEDLTKCQGLSRENPIPGGPVAKVGTIYTLR